MKRVVVFVCVLMIFTLSNAQRKFDLGVFTGGSYYLGDINQSRQLYAPSIAIGGFYRYNINPRYSIRGNMYYGGLKGDDRDFNNTFQNWRSADFKARILDVAMQFEFNFLPYDTRGKKWDYSPYVAGGVGFSFISSTSSLTYKIVLPFGVGLKVNVAKRLSAGMEWGFRKTFYDGLDGLENWNDPGYPSLFHNYDWYSFTGIFVTYKIFHYRDDCPAYWDASLRKKWR
ncbi:MAG: outer membrane beta-barrel protein [Bacteroidales bacterium]|nr:outer membrane beta-barrel protein [Bacteroidales bacterium]